MTEPLIWAIRACKRIALRKLVKELYEYCRFSTIMLKLLGNQRTFKQYIVRQRPTVHSHINIPVVASMPSAGPADAEAGDLESFPPTTPLFSKVLG